MIQHYDHYIENIRASTIQREKARHIKRYGAFKDSRDETLYESYLRYYPLDPFAPPSGSYGNRVDSWPDSQFDRTYYEEDDPMYYTPKRAWQLGHAFNTKFEREKYNLERMHDQKVKWSDKQMMFRRMQLEQSNICGAQEEIHEVNDAVIESYAFRLNDDTDSLQFKAQMLEFMLWAIDPQRMVMLETYLCLQHLGIYQHLDASTLVDFYEYSMIHPNAIVCSACRSCRWIFANPSRNNDEFIMCIAPHCPVRLKRRDRPADAYLALPYDNFNYKMWAKYVNKYCPPNIIYNNMKCVEAQLIY